jgi:hypothetical protein
MIAISRGCPQRKAEVKSGTVIEASAVSGKARLKSIRGNTAIELAKAST